MAVLPDIADYNAYHCYDYNAWRIGGGEGAINFDRPEVGYYVQLPADGQVEGGYLILDYGREDAETRDLYL